MSRLAAASAAVLLAAGLISLGAAPKVQTVTITGEVEVAEEDEDGNVVAVYIDDVDHGFCLVAAQGRGRELWRHVGHVVKATGRLVESENEEYDWLFQVTSFVVEEEEDEDEADEDAEAEEEPEDDEDEPEDDDEEDDGDGGD